MKLKKIVAEALNEVVVPLEKLDEKTDRMETNMATKEDIDSWSENTIRPKIDLMTTEKELKN